MHHFCDIVVGEVVEGIEDKCCALLVLEFANGLVQQSCLFLLQHLVLARIHALSQWVGNDWVVGDDAAVTLNHLGDDIDGDAVYESTQARCVSETRKGCVELYEDLLRYLVNIKLVAYEFVA